MEQTDYKLELDLWLDQSIISRQNQLKATFWDIFSSCANEVSLEELQEIHSKSMGSKLTRGNDLKGFPYQVLDFIRDFDSENGLNIRIINWFGHGLFLFILLGKNHPKKTSPSFFTNNLRFSLSNSAWDYPDIIVNKNYIKAPTLTHFDDAELFQWFTPIEITDCLEVTKQVINDKLKTILGLLT